MLVHPLQPQVGCFGVLKGGPCGLFHSPHSSSTSLAQGWGWGPWSALGHILHFPSSRLSSSQGWMSLSSGCCQSGYRAKKLQLDLLQIYAALGSIRTPQGRTPSTIFPQYFSGFRIFAMLCNHHHSICLFEKKALYHNWIFFNILSSLEGNSRQMLQNHIIRFLLNSASHQRPWASGLLSLLKREVIKGYIDVEDISVADRFSPFSWIVKRVQSEIFFPNMWFKTSIIQCSVHLKITDDMCCTLWETLCQVFPAVGKPGLPFVRIPVPP